MMESFSILADNKDFVFGAYNFGPLVIAMMVGAVIDLLLKGWGMWRAARMGKTGWFITLLVFNTLGLLPVVFLLLTNAEYTKKEGR